MLGTWKLTRQHQVEMKKQVEASSFTLKEKAVAMNLSDC
jgi:hypothetical protein